MSIEAKWQSFLRNHNGIDEPLLKHVFVAGAAAVFYELKECFDTPDSKKAGSLIMKRMIALSKEIMAE